MNRVYNVLLPVQIRSVQGIICGGVMTWAGWESRTPIFCFHTIFYITGFYVV